MTRYVFDIETNGLIPELDTIHCLVAKDLDTGGVFSCHDHEGAEFSIMDGLSRLALADQIVGHNIMGFDIPAIQKVHPSWKPLGQVRDTLVMSRLLFPDLRDRDFQFRVMNPDFPAKLIGSHSLRAWGHRIHNFKEDYDDGWDNWSPEMQHYCVQDVTVTASLWDKLLSKKPSDESVELEHRVFEIIQRQEQHGFLFDLPAARSLYANLLGRQSDLGADLARCFPSWTVSTPFTPKRDNKARGYKAGVTVSKEQLVEFNPNSRDHVAAKLTEKYGWKPTAFTPEGKPQIDEEVLAPLPYPEAKLLAESFMLTKRLGQVGEGKNSWLKLERNGRLHGRINTNGAVTGRMTHSHPNMAQVPSVRAPYGKECRALFIAGPGKLLVGCDADALELRCLAGYMANYDNGAYIKTVLEGKKSDATDMHSVNARVLGCDRDTAKTWFYAFIYGAGDTKLGSILGTGHKGGKQARARFLEGLPALRKLVGGVQTRTRQRGYLLGLDGRHLPVRSEHAALNTLLQSAGAIFMKKALVLLDADLKSKGYEYEFVANVHDEWQIEVKEEHADKVGNAAVSSIRRAGEAYNFKCPLDGQFVIGKNWADTH
jgi:DNA polymerase I